MEKIGKALERRGASFVWAGRGHTSKGETPVQVERFRVLVPVVRRAGNYLPVRIEAEIFRILSSDFRGGSSTGCKPRADNRLFRGEKGVLPERG